MKTKGYFAVFGALAALTGMTVLAAEMKLGMTVGLLIALTKAFLVGAFFMHLQYEGRFTRFVALAPVAFFLVMLLLILPDFVG